MAWPTWELRAHGSAAPDPAPDPAAPDDPRGSRGPGCPLPRLDPLGPWCSARLTFADGARVDVLVTVSDDHITVEDVRADPPLTLAGLTDLARWIEGPLDDAFRSATGRPHRPRPTPRQAGPVTTSVTTAVTTAAEPETESTGAGEGAMAGGCVAPAAQGEAAQGGGVLGEGAASGTSVASDLSAGSATSTAAPASVSPTPAESSAPSESSTSADSSEPPVSEPPISESPVSEPPACEPPVSEPSASVSATSSDPSTLPGSSAAAPSPERARATVLARSRAGERRRVAADAYRRAQREGSDPVLAVMLATGRNRRRSLRLIAGARDEGLLAPRHNKR
ncbi:DUF6214 family protein [Streptomyces lydicus]|uniref:DUF6214 family protein n=1 Tax=Streptomyces lydicus TaxID=47763 RepID=UPI0010119BC6